MSTTLPLFWHLSSNSKKERVEASVKLVDALEQFQAQFVPKPSPETTEDEEDQSDEEAEDTLDTLNAQDVSYSIRRLVRGLASPRESSRLGFAVALTELLSRINTITCSQLVSLIMDCSKTQGSMSGQEERDMLFARLFGLTAVIKSGLIVRSAPLPSSSTVAATLTSYLEVVKQLIALGEKKSWLRESTWWTLELALDVLIQSEVEWKEEGVGKTMEVIYEDEKTWSPEKIAVTVMLQERYPQRDWRKYLAPTFKNPRILNTANLATLAKLLKESTSEDDEETGVKAAAAGAWKPQVHYVWDIILDALLPSTSSSPNKQPQGSLQEFFRVVVDDSLFAATSSAERKYWGFQIFLKALSRVSASDMPMLFTKNFMRCWINHLSKPDRYLHKVAKQVATEMQTIVSKDSTMGFTLIVQLTGVNGSRQFDKLTRTKTVEGILASMDAEGIKAYIDHLLEQVDEEVTERTDIQALNARRSWIIDQLAALVRNGAIPKQDDWISAVLEWLTVHGLFEVKKKADKSPFRAVRSVPKPPLSDELREACRARLLSCLADLVGSSTHKKTDSAKAVSDGHTWVAKTLDVIGALEKDKKHVSMFVDLDEDEKNLRSRASEIVASLESAPEEQRDLAQGAKTLVQSTLVYQLCQIEEGRDHAEALEACLEAASRLLETKSKKDKKRKKSESAAADEEGPIPVDVFVDTIIGFLEEPSSYMRAVANLCFGMFATSVRESTVDLILAQLERRDPSELLEDGEEDERMSAEEGEDDSAEDDEKSNDEEGEPEDDEDEDAEEPDAEFRKKIEAALQASGAKALEGDDVESSEEELMDDDQMMAIDEQLAAVFKSRTAEAKKGKDVNAQREATHFKNRVLDLVDIMVKTNPTGPLITRLVMPLLELISGCSKDEKHLSDKAGGILRSRIGKLKEVSPQIDIAETSKLLEELHTQARRARSADILASFSQCSVYLSRVLLQHGGEERVLAAYRESLMDYVARKTSSLNAQFFQDFIRHFPSSAWLLRNDLLEVTGKAVNVYRQCQAYLLLQGLLTQLTDLESRSSELVDFMPSLRQNLLKILSDACDNTATLSSAQVKDVLKLALTAARQTARVVQPPNSVAKIWEPRSWEDLQEKLKESQRFKSSSGLHAMCKQMVELASGPASAAKAVGNKRKHRGPGNDGEAAEGGPSPAKKKRVKTKGVKSQ
ncbi:hypothetical protein OE88DRAFT_1667862 [Heliocybe sulcata]|uniref:DNA polymerase phi-domain-containing protein n=1 Tax=Heliocybe sulcata TaxID=5364 RepID=A0A5C3MPZ9_9AGAM|nr:hypothetical protein OE88DRAFT_1667862 [Heliocybe sulcata]